MDIEGVLYRSHQDIRVIVFLGSEGLEKKDFCQCSIFIFIFCFLSFSFRLPHPTGQPFFYDCVKVSQNEDMAIFSFPSAITTTPPSILSREALIAVIVAPSVVVLVLVVIAIAIIVLILVCGKKGKIFV